MGTEPDDSALSYMAGNGFLVALRRNLPLIMAFIALAGTVGGGYASYRMMEIRMVQAEERIGVIGNDLYDHLRTTTVHVDPVRDARDREEILRRLVRIEQKLDEKK